MNTGKSALVNIPIPTVAFGITSPRGWRVEGREVHWNLKGLTFFIPSLRIHVWYICLHTWILRACFFFWWGDIFHALRRCVVFLEHKDVCLTIRKTMQQKIAHTFLWDPNFIGEYHSDADHPRRVMTSGSEQPKMYVKQEVRENSPTKKPSSNSSLVKYDIMVVHPLFGGTPALSNLAVWVSFLLATFPPELWCYLCPKQKNQIIAASFLGTFGLVCRHQDFLLSKSLLLTRCFVLCCLWALGYHFIVFVGTHH